MTLLDARVTSPTTGGPSFSLQNRLYRAIWNSAWVLLASWTPPAMHVWRRFVLRLFGARIHRTAIIHGSARIWYPANLEMAAHSCLGRGVICYSMAKISLQPFALVSQGAHLCAGTHDIDDGNFQLQARPITLGARSWVAAEAFVGPGVTVGEGAVLGARSVAFKDLAPWSVSIGNPARFSKMRKNPSAEGASDG